MKNDESMALGGLCHELCHDTAPHDATASHGPGLAASTRLPRIADWDTLQVGFDAASLTWKIVEPIDIDQHHSTSINMLEAWKYNESKRTIGLEPEHKGSQTAGGYGKPSSDLLCWGWCILLKQEPIHWEQGMHKAWCGIAELGLVLNSNALAARLHGIPLLEAPVKPGDDKVVTIPLLRIPRLHTATLASYLCHLGLHLPCAAQVWQLEGVRNARPRRHK